MRKILEEIYDYESQPFLRVINLLIYSYWLIKMLALFNPVIAIILSMVFTVIVMIVSWLICERLDRY